jgi:hypothetical protein
MATPRTTLLFGRQATARPAVIDRRYRNLSVLNGTIDFLRLPIVGRSFWPPVLKIGGEDRRPTILGEGMRARGDSNLKPSDP